MRFLIRITAAALLLLSIHAHAQPGIGQWREHFPYRNTRLVIEGNGSAYCATRNGVFRADPNTNEVTRLTKVNALSTVDVSALGWSTDRNSLLVGYGTGDLDIIGSGSTYNLSDIRRSTIIGDKRIYGISCVGNLAYLSCGFGIVVVDMDRREVADTWIIFPNAELRKVNGVAFLGDSIYAATEVGLFSAKSDNSNLAAFSNWRKRTDFPRPNADLTHITTFQGRLCVNANLAGENDTLFLWNNGPWEYLQSLGTTDIKSVQVSADQQRLVLGLSYSARQYNAQFQQIFNVAQAQGEVFLMSGAAPAADGGAWAATTNTGLVRCYPDGSGSLIIPNGPRTTGAYRLDMQQSVLMVATGAVAGNWTNTFGHEGVHVFRDGDWRTISEPDDPLMLGLNNYGGGAVDPMAVAVDPENKGHAFTGSWEEGVLEWQDGAVTTIWNATNSSLNANTAGGDLVFVAGLDFDKDGNLWVSNANNTHLLSVRAKNGAWHSFSPGGITNGNQLVSDVTAARENDLKWLVRPRGNGLLVFTDGGTIDEPGDDQWKVITNVENQGALPTLEISCVAEDLDGEVWIGSSKGISVFYNPEAMFAEDEQDWDSQQILIEQDGNIQILLETEVVNCIAVDGANRKWIGTQTSGAFLVSPDGTVEVHHFTAENSPLPSNNVLSIAIDGLTGEVFFGTDQGITSYRSDATEGGRAAECASVFPNPVRETYQGPVAITGLVADSDVRITDIAGNLVYKTTSLGGQAIWPATDLSGQRVSTGVYLVMASDPSGSSTCNTKVLVVR